MRRFHFALLALLLSLAAQPLLAATYYVGNCNAGGYGTIQAAVTAATAGSTINVCPGTYPEQVVIAKALTLQGIVSSNSSQAVIALPTSGGLPPTPSAYWGSVMAQVEISAGPVNITNITVDGGAGTSNCPSVGIHYGTGSSGTVNEVETRDQNYCFSGAGIMAENGSGAVQTVKIANSVVHDYLCFGIMTYSSSPSTLTTTISGNYVYGGGSLDYAGIVAHANTAGAVSGNTVSGSTRGVLAYSSSVTISGNTVTDGSYGIDVQAAASITSNRIFNTPTGIFLGVAGSTIKSNTIAKATISGVQMNCWAATITGNTINGATTGLDYVPSAFAGANKFYNVATVRNRENCP
jgi:parallel beta-helix repeat protein